MHTQNDNVDHTLLSSLSDLVLCSRCFQNGTVTPVPQLISHRHRLRNECSGCTEARRAEERPKQGPSERYLSS